MRIELRAPGDLTPYAGNPRRIPAAAVDAVARSIRRYGFRQPVVVDGEGVVLVGHTRLQAAKQLGLATVPVHVAADLTPEQAAAYRLADNRTNEIAEWDDQALAAELSVLAASAAADLGALSDITAFDARELERLLGPPPGQTEPDDVPEPTEPITTFGDLWVLGRHRLLCGDSTKAEDVARVLGSATPPLMVTDPPYGVRYDPTWRAKAGVNRNTKKLGAVANDDRADWSDAWRLFPGAVAYVWHAGLKSSIVQTSLERAAFTLRAQIIWAKDRLALSRGDYHWQHEPCWYGVREGQKGRRAGDRAQSTLWRIPTQYTLETPPPPEATTVWDIPSRDDDGHGHGTQKPVECMERPLRNHEGDVYDPFVGSGTTLIAAERQGRACYALETEPRYVDMAVARWEAYTGQQAARAS